MIGECLPRLTAIGISYGDACELRRIATTLHRWHELECGDGNDATSWCIVRGHWRNGAFEYDDNGDAYMERHYHRAADAKAHYHRVADRERGALKRLRTIGLTSKPIRVAPRCTLGNTIRRPRALATRRNTTIAALRCIGDAMPRPTIDYLNARREAIRNRRGVSKGRGDRVVNPVDTRRRDSDQHPLDLAHDQVLAIFAEFRSWFAESTRALHARCIQIIDDYERALADRAKREATKPMKAAKPQEPCDVGLFGDEHLQLDLVEMLQDPDPQ